MRRLVVIQKLKSRILQVKNVCQNKHCQFQHYIEEGGNIGLDKTNYDIETANTYDKEVTIN